MVFDRKKSPKNLVLKKGVFLTKFHFYIKHSTEISRKGILHFDQESSYMIGNQTYHRTNMFSPYLPNSCYESDYGCICIMISGKTCSVPLNILSSVVSFSTVIVCLFDLILYVPSTIFQLNRDGSYCFEPVLS